jgi:hypothetical protein
MKLVNASSVKITIGGVEIPPLDYVREGDWFSRPLVRFPPASFVIRYGRQWECGFVGNRRGHYAKHAGERGWCCHAVPLGCV